MAAAYSNSLQALNGIYGALDQIIKTIERSNTPEGTKEKKENTVKDLNRGSLSGALTSDKGPTSTSTNATIPTSASIRDISSALLSLPPAIRAIVNIRESSINKVVDMIERLNVAFSDLGDGNNALKGAATFKTLASGLLALQELKFFQLIIKLHALESIDFEKTLGKALTGLVNSYKTLDGLTKKDIDNYITFTSNISNLTKTVKEFSKVSALMPIFNLSVAMFVPAMNKLIKMTNKMPDKSKVESAIQSTKMVTDLAKGAAMILATSIGLAVALQKFDTKNVLLGIGVTVGVVTLLSGLALTIELFGRRSRGARRNLRQLNMFINGLVLSTGLIFGLAILYSTQSSAINQGLLAVGAVLLGVTALAVTVGIVSKFLHIRREMNAITRFMTGMMLMTGAVLLLGKYAAEAKPLMVQGLGIVMGVLASITALAVATGLAMSFIHPVAMGSVIAFMGFSMALVLGTLLIGALVSNDATRSMLLAGLGVTAGIMLAYTTLAVGASFLGMLVLEGAPFLGQVLKFAAFSLALVVGTMFIGALITVGLDILLRGLGGVLGVVLAYETIFWAVSKFGLKIPTGIVGLKNIALFAAGCIAVAFATVALGMAMERAGWWTVAAIGLLGTIIGSVYGISLLIDKMHTSTSIAAAIPELKVIGAFLGGAELLAGGIVGLAYALKGLISGDDWARGTIAIAGVFAIIAAVIKGAEITAVSLAKAKPLTETGLADMKSTLLFIAGCELLAGGIIGLAVALKALDDASEGKAAEYVLDVFGIVTLIVTEGVLVAKALSISKPEMEKGTADIKSTLLFMGACELLAGGVLGLAYALKEFTDDGQDFKKGAAYIGGAFLLISAITIGGVAIAKEISASKSTMDKGVVDIKSVLLFMGGAELLAFGMVGLAKALENVGEGMITGALALTSGILVGSVKLAEYVSEKNVALKQGAKDIGAALALMGGAELLAGGVIGLAFALKKLLGGQELTVASAATGVALVGGVFGMMYAMVLGAGEVANIAARQQQNIKQGAIALLLAEGVIAGSAAVLYAVIKIADQGKGKWNDVTTALTEMAIILAAAGTMALVASSIENNVKKGAIALALCEALAAGSALVLAAVIKVASYGRETLGESWAKESLKALGEMALIVGGIGAMAFAAGALIVGPQALWFGAGVAGLAACEALGYAGAKMLKVMIEVSDIGGEEIGKKVSTTLDVMRSVIKELGKTAAMGLAEAIRIRRGANALKQVTKISGALIENIDQLVKLSTYMEKNGTSPDALTASLRNILDVISPKMFVDFFEESNINEQMKKVNKGYKAYKKIVDIVKTSLDVYSDFIVKTKGIKVNEAELVNISTSISSSLEVFMNALTDKTYNISKKTVKRLSLVLTNLIEPVSSFAELVSKYKSTSAGTLSIITYDENGKPRIGESINISDTAQTILSAVMTFCDVLYNPTNEEIWKNITKGTSKKGSSTLQAGIGIFASIMDPVAQFAEVLTMFNADAEKGELLIPEYNNEGKLIRTRSVNVKAVASVIAGSVTTFIEELYVKHKDSWVTILESLNKIDPTIEMTADKENKTGNKAGLSEAIGIFGEILNPVLNFASVLLKFGTEKGKLTVFDENGKAKTVDVAAISSNIANGVTAFITSIAGIFTNPEMMDKIKALSENSIGVLDVVNGFVTDISNASQIDASKLEQVNKSTELFTNNLQTLLDSLTKNYTTQDLGMFKAVFKVIMESVTSYADTAFAPEGLEKIGAGTEFLINNTKMLMSGFITREELDNFKLLLGELTSFLKVTISDLTEVTASSNINIDQIQEEVESFLKKASLIKKSINSSLQDMMDINISTSDLNKYVVMTSSIREGMNNILGIKVDEVGVTRTTSMYNSIINSIHTLINEDEITNIDKFNQNYDTLMKNLDSASQDAKVKKINNLSNAVVKTSNSLKGFDSTLNDGNKKRIQELDNFGKAVGRITDKLKSSQNEINDLRDLLNKLERVNPSNVSEIAEQVSRMTSVQTVGGIGGGPSINTTELAEKIAIAIAAVLSNTSLGLQNIKISTTNNKDMNETNISGYLDIESEYNEGFPRY